MQVAMTRSARYCLLGFCLIGGSLSAASLHNHYSTAATEYCDLSATFNCDLVNRSSYASMFGVPVALIGILGYLLLFGLSLRTGRRLAILRLGAAVIGLGFALYLAYVEAYILGVWCVLCLGSMASIFAVTVLSAIGLRPPRGAKLVPPAGRVRPDASDGLGR
jgi:vitamin-K-epoxide reductase (warfarin-sensitive)